MLVIHKDGPTHPRLIKRNDRLNPAGEAAIREPDCHRRADNAECYDIFCCGTS